MPMSPPAYETRVSHASFCVAPMKVISWLVSRPYSGRKSAGSPSVHLSASSEETISSSKAFSVFTRTLMP